MGYSLSVGDLNFFIKKENIQKALELVQKAIPSFKDYSSFEEMMNDNDWKVYKDKDSNIKGLYFNGENFHDEYDIFNAIAPVVKDGSQINIRIDCECYKWRFENGEFIETYEGEF